MSTRSYQYIHSLRIEHNDMNIKVIKFWYHRNIKNEYDEYIDWMCDATKQTDATFLHKLWKMKHFNEWLKVMCLKHKHKIDMQRSQEGKKIIDESQSYLENNGACNSHLKHFIFISGSTQCSEKDAYEYQSVKVAKCQPNLDHIMIIGRYNPTQLVGYLHTHVNNPTNTQLQSIYQSKKRLK